MLKRSTFLVALIFAASACSAIVHPDEGRLGGTDAGHGSDGGQRVDAGSPCGMSCDDGVACTVDTCQAGHCVHMGDAAMCGPGQRCDLSTGCTTAGCSGPRDCDDGNPCTNDMCNAGTCANVPSPRGTACNAGYCTMGAQCDGSGVCGGGTPRSCDDGAACTSDSCDNAAGHCVHTPDDTVCDDAIDCTADQCQPDAAMDSSGCVHTPDDTVCASGYCMTGGRCDPTVGCTGGTARNCVDGDQCTADTCSEAAMMCLHAPRDDDGDGYPLASTGTRACPGGTDCNDSDPSAYPGAPEICNGRDDDCDGYVDESCITAPGDTCSDAQPIPLTGGSGTVRGVLSNYQDDYDTSCGDPMGGGPDVVYYVDVTSLSDVEIDTIGSDPSTDTVLAVGTTCSGDGLRAACDDDIDQGRVIQSRMWIHRFGHRTGSTPERLYILVDGYRNGVVGPYTLNVHVQPATADTCTMPIDISGGGALVGVIGTVMGGETGSCQGGRARSASEGVATLRGPISGSVTLNAFASSFDPDLYLRSAPCGSGTELACQHGGPIGGGANEASLMTSTTLGNRYYVFVDGAALNDEYLLSYNP